MKRILAGDIGGTKTRLGLFEWEQGHLQSIFEKAYSSKAYPGLETILADFMKELNGINSACLGVAAPVIGKKVKLTNLPWVMDIQKLKKEFSLPKLEIINDLVANAYGTIYLKKKDLRVVNPGKRMVGNAALLSAGTGLGEAILYWDGECYHPSPSEGGHADFGPRNELEIELLRYLIERFGHVSYERILSGSGLFHIYQFLRDEKKLFSEPSWLSKRMREKDPAVVISEEARTKGNKLCQITLEIFVTIYGAAAGNLALHSMAVGGVYLGGGIAPKILWKLREGAFMKAFKDKGRYSDFVARIPVKVIMNERTALLGAAWFATNI